MPGRSCLWLGAVAVALALPARAEVHNLFAFLDGLQEVPPVPTTGSGSATMTLDDVSNMFTLTGSFQDLIGTTNNAHVHGPAPVGVSAGVMFGIPFDSGVTSGNFSFNGVISDAHEQTILDGLAYINIHTSFRPGGEIRGQIIPEPSTLAILCVGTLALLRRRR